MDIIILADFCGRFNEGGNSRFLYLANLLSSSHEVEVITSDFNHGTKEYFKKIPSEFPYKITMLHEGMYKKNVCLARFKAHYIWGKNVRKYLEKRRKPDVIYCAVPTLKASYEAAKYCEKNKIKFVVDIQDLWPEAFQMVFNIPVLSQMIFAPFKYLADEIYKRADEICAVSQTYVERGMKVNRKCKKGYSVFLGTRLETFDKNAKGTPMIEKKDGEIWLGYCGTLGKSYDLENVIQALYLLKKQDLKTPKFIVMGSGEKLNILKHMAEEKDIDIYFTGMLPYEQMCTMLCKCDMVVNPIIGTSVASIINKHADYAASGLPVINTQESKEYKQLVSNYGMGFNCKNGDAKDMAKKIEILVNDPEMREQMGKNSRRCAEEKFDRANTYQKIETCLTQKEMRTTI